MNCNGRCDDHDATCEVVHRLHGRVVELEELGRQMAIAVDLAADIHSTLTDQVIELMSDREWLKNETARIERRLIQELLKGESDVKGSSATGKPGDEV